MGATGRYPKKVDWDAVDQPGIADWLGQLADDREEAVAATLPPPPVDPEEERWEEAITVAAKKMARARMTPVTYDKDGNDVNATGTRSEHVWFDDPTTAVTTVDEDGEIIEVLPPMPAGLREQFEPMGVRPADGPSAPAHGTMKTEGRPREKETTVTTTIETMSRRSAVTGAHGIYAEGRVFNAKGGLVETRRAFLAAEFLGISTMGTSAKGARWEVTAYESGAPEAQAALSTYLGVENEPGLMVDTTAIICELTAGDIDRIRRGVMPSLIYPAAGLLEEAIEKFKDQVD